MSEAVSSSVTQSWTWVSEITDQNKKGFIMDEVTLFFERHVIREISPWGEIHPKLKSLRPTIRLILLFLFLLEKPSDFFFFSSFLKCQYTEIR